SESSSESSSEGSASPGAGASASASTSGSGSGPARGGSATSVACSTCGATGALGVVAAAAPCENSSSVSLTVMLLRVDVETDALVVQPVPELIPLGGQIALVLLVRDDLEADLLDHREAEPVEAGELLRVVREDADRGQAEVGEDLVADPPLARVGRE